MRSIAFLSVLLVVPCCGALAQTPLLLEPGQRVRITAPLVGWNKQVARFEGVENDALIAVSDSMVRLPLSSVERIESHAGRHNRPWAGLGIGFGIGAVSGAVLASSSAQGDISGGDAALIGAAVFGTGGAVLGLITGLMVQTDKWDDVPLDNLRVSLVPRHEGRLVLAVSGTF